MRLKLANLKLKSFVTDVKRSEKVGASAVGLGACGGDESKPGGGKGDPCNRWFSQDC